jgi:hypothetical protein
MTSMKFNPWLAVFPLLIVVIIIGLAYDHHQRGRLFTERASNASYFIERALQTIPTCTYDDRARQRTLIDMLQTWTNLIHSFHIPYWISHQTLTSYNRYHNIAAYDLTIDLSVMAEDLSKIDRLVRANLSSDYELKIFSERTIDNHWLMNLQANDSIDYKAQLINSKLNVSINIWPSYVHSFVKHRPQLIQRVNSTNWTQSSLDLTLPLEWCVLSGIQVWCPAQPKSLVDSIYREIAGNVSCRNSQWIRV